MTHEDERRILESWPEAKIITAKQDCVLGNHYHKKKAEVFILLKGEAKLTTSNFCEKSLEIGQAVIIAPLTLHTFELTKDSVLIGLCSHPYDPTDDYK